MPLKNKEAHKKYCRDYHRTHKNTNVERAVEWNQTHPKERKKTHKKYHNNHKDKEKEYRHMDHVIKNRQRNRLHKRYGITKEKFDKMVAEQGNRCKICEKVFTKTPHLDHDHKEGKIRGLLCQYCNWMLGNAGDSVTVLMNAIKYLEGDK